MFLQTPGGSFIGVALSVLLAATTSFVICSLLLKTGKKTEESGELAAATAKMEALKGKKSSVVRSADRRSRPRRWSADEARRGTPRTSKPIHNIVFACDAGMGSSAMGASVLRNKVKKAGFTDVTVVNVAIANLTDDIDLIVTHQDLTPRARDKVAERAARLGRQLHEQPAVRRDRRRAEDHQRAGRRVLAVTRPRRMPPPWTAVRGARPARNARESAMSDILTVSQIKVPGTATTKDEAIREAGQILVDAGAVTPAYVDAMFEREKSVSTYMGNFLAIPHGTNEAKDDIKASALSVVRYEQPIDWDGNEVRFAVGIAGVENGHLEILGKIAVIFSDMDEVDKLIAAGSAEEVYEILNAVNERMTKTAVHFGAGNIGRGFVGLLLHRAGYRSSSPTSPMR